MGECLIDVIQCKAFKDVLADPSSAKQRLLLLCEGFVTKLQEWRQKKESGHKFSYVVGNSDDDRSAIEFQLERLRVLFLGLLALLAVTPGHLGCSVFHINALRSHKGGNSMEAWVRDVLTESEWWTRLYDDMIVKSAASTTLAPDLAALTADFSQDGHPTQDALAKAKKLLPNLRKSMRAGSTNELEKIMLKKLLVLAKEILAGEYKDKELSLGLVNSVYDCLGLHTQTNGVLQLIQKIDAWRHSQVSVLARQEIMALLPRYPEERDGDMPDNLKESLDMLVAAFEQVADLDFSPELFKGLEKVLFWHFRDFHGRLKAGHDSPSEP